MNIELTNGIGSRDEAYLRDLVFVPGIYYKGLGPGTGPKILEDSKVFYFEVRPPSHLVRLERSQTELAIEKRSVSVYK